MKPTKNLEKVILDELSEQFRKSMDFDYMCDVLTEVGWVVVDDIDYRPDKPYDEIAFWVAANCTGKYQVHLGKWLFEQPKDATIFTLRWRD